MKKLFKLLLSCMVVFGLSACANNNEDTGQSNPTKQTDTPTQTEQSIDEAFYKDFKTALEERWKIEENDAEDDENAEFEQRKRSYIDYETARNYTTDLFNYSEKRNNEKLMELIIKFEKELKSDQLEKINKLPSKKITDFFNHKSN